MKKQELIHMHGLLVEVADHLPATESAMDVPAYRSISVRPSSLHRPKSDHQRAVMALARGLTEGLAPDHRRKPPARR